MLETNINIVLPHRFFHLQRIDSTILNYKACDTFIADLNSDNHTLSLSLLIFNSQFVVVAKEINNKNVLGLIHFDLTLGFNKREG